MEQMAVIMKHLFTSAEGKDSNWLNETCKTLCLCVTQTVNGCGVIQIKGGDSTPIPVIIQQDKKRLEDLREKTGYTDEE